MRGGRRLSDEIMLIKTIAVLGRSIFCRMAPVIISPLCSQ